jgi:peptidoglycan glycosyltransferase
VRRWGEGLGGIRVGVCLLFSVAGIFWGSARVGSEPSSGLFPGLPIRSENGELRFDRFRPRLDRIEEDRYVSRFPNGVKVVYSIDVSLQQKMEALFRQYRVPYGAFVALDPKSGKVLALVEYTSSGIGGGIGGDPLTLRASFPAASIFKLITASALLEEKKVSPETVVRFRGGVYRLRPKYLTDDPRRDRRRMTLADALATSCNIVFAKAALRWLDRETLLRYAEAYQFNRSIPFELPVQISRAEIDPTPKDLAYSAAGFGDVGLSPLHGALIAAAISNGGRMMAPHLVERIVGPDDRELFSPQPSVIATAISPETAGMLERMMAITVMKGTSRKAFRARRGHALPRGITIGGKTGSLTGDDPKGKYSWFVGMAPLEAPEIAVAALVINHPLWRVKSSFIAREGFSAYFKPDPMRKATAVR